MERWFWVAILSCCISCLQSTVSQAQTGVHATAEADSAEAEEEEDKKRDPRFIVGFDAGVEVLFTMVRLREGIPPATVYAAEIDSVFGPFRDHPAVGAIGNLLDRGVRLEVMLNTLLCHGPAPDFVREFPYWTPDSTAAGTSDEDRARLLSAVRSFHLDTRFQEFWDPRWEKIREPADAEEETQSAEAAALEETLQDTTLPSAAPEDSLPLWTKGYEAVEDSLYVLLHAEMAQEPYQIYYGSRGNSTYRFIPTWQSPVDTVLATRSGGREILAWVAPIPPDSVALLDRERLDRQRAVALGMSVVEPLAGWLWPYLAEYEYLYEYLMRGRGRFGVWSSWGGCFVEHLRRAVHARVLLAMRGEDAADEYLERLTDQGYGLLRVLYDSLTEYEMGRDHYLSLPDFTPRLISTLGTVEVEVTGREPAFGVRFRQGISGLVVTEVLEGLMAARVGIEVGDVLISVDGEPPTMDTDVEALARRRGVGGRLEIEVQREGRVRRLTLLLGADLVNYRFSSRPARREAATLSSPTDNADQQQE
ncbi:MAG: DUF4932 domain-containing protein [Candidatus Eisenbacteria sp.]|nr:DUF4932 domain-containing protein [Candidatus Eisenbacteria bacterium]